MEDGEEAELDEFGRLSSIKNSVIGAGVSSSTENVNRNHGSSNNTKLSDIRSHAVSRAPLAQKPKSSKQRVCVDEEKRQARRRSRSIKSGSVARAISLSGVSREGAQAETPSDAKIRIREVFIPYTKKTSDYFDPSLQYGGESV